jgi:hypothetical protein
LIWLPHVKALILCDLGEDPNGEDSLENGDKVDENRDPKDSGTVGGVEMADRNVCVSWGTCWVTTRIKPPKLIYVHEWQVWGVINYLWGFKNWFSVVFNQFYGKGGSQGDIRMLPGP